MSWPRIAHLVEQVKTGQVKAEDLVKKSLNNIKDGEEYNAIILTDEKAIQKATEIDAKINNGEQVGRLAGIPFILKDNFLSEGIETTAASNILKGFIPPYSATALKKLEAEDAILVAKANLDAFAHGSSTENSDFGVTLNPHDKTRVAGGSSGGSAAAVALDMAPFALGTDTGGSIRLPASFTGTVGYKPTYGLVSRFGVVAMASSTDVIGPIANSVEDTALIMDIISGRDQFDSTTIDRIDGPYTDLEIDFVGKKVGIVKEYLSEGLEPSVAKSIEDAKSRLTKLGVELTEISISNIEKALAVYYIVMPAEVSSNLSRYDGIKYGHSSSNAKTLDETYELSRSEGFNQEVKRRILIGTYVLSSGYYDAYYKKAQAVRTVLINEFNSAFDKVDFLLGPTSPTVAFKVGENTTDPLKMYLTDIMTVAANLVGIPAISLPLFKDDNNLPIGVQLMAPQRHDRELLALSAKLMETSK